MSMDDPVKGRRAPQWLPLAGIALATPFLAWFAIGDVSTYRLPTLSHEFGPYHVGPESGYVVGGLASVVWAVAVVVLVIQTRRGVADWRSGVVAATLAMTGALAAYGWRILTAGYTGAPLGAGLVWLFDPLLIAGLLVVAVWIAGGRRWRLRRIWLLTLAAILVAPALYALLAALASYDSSAGVITGLQYADVRVGQTRSDVHERLGREGEDSSFEFPPEGPALRCDYYLEEDRGAKPLPYAYQFCFRTGVLVGKDIR